MASDWHVVTHGGAGSDPDLEDATDEAAGIALEALKTGANPLEAACRAVAALEDDGRFNAGVGSNVRADGSTIQMDAACADSRDRFGAVACIERVQNPVSVARHVTDTDHLVLAGHGAQAFAERHGIPDVDPSQLEGQPLEASGRDTVGCVLGDGEVFAAALSSGGTREATVGRVGDVPLPGCGLRAGAQGAVAATGHGETIARRRMADRAYERMVEGRAVDQVVEAAVDGTEAALGLIAVDAEGGAGGSNRSMAYSCRTG